ncbi:MAG: hypothetical protein R6U63_04580 [Longimicrobiales bacterium]
MSGPEDFDAERRRIVRKLALLTWGARALAVLLAVGGGALLAWILTGAGFSFMRTWLNVSLLLILVPIAVHLWPGPKPWEKDDED